MKKNVFICVTPFQVFTSIMIASQISGKSDVIISNIFSGYDIVAKRIKTTGIFNNVIVVDESKIWSINKKNYVLKELSALKTYVLIKKIAKNILPKINEYTDVYSPGRKNMIGKIIYNYVAQFNDGCHIHFYDEGTAIYSNICVDIKKKDYLCTKMFIGKKAANFVYDLFLFSPECYRYINPNRDTQIVKINVLESVKPVLLDLFPDKVEISNEAQAIIFDVLYDQEFSEDGKKAYLDIVNHIGTILNCVVKKHPREKHAYDCLPEMKYNHPFEVMWLSNSVNDKILISPFSTALFTPKMIFNDEPTIILLYKMFVGSRKKESDTSVKLLEWIKESYINKQKVIIPKNIEELDFALENIEKMNN